LGNTVVESADPREGQYSWDVVCPQAVENAPGSELHDVTATAAARMRVVVIAFI
jgi:hypothetical protein